jgi:hypothetical protein
MLAGIIMQRFLPKMAIPDSTTREPMRLEYSSKFLFPDKVALLSNKKGIKPIMLPRFQ